MGDIDEDIVHVPLCFQGLWTPWISLAFLHPKGPWAWCYTLRCLPSLFLSASPLTTASLDRSESCPNWNHGVFFFFFLKKHNKYLGENGNSYMFIFVSF